MKSKILNRLAVLGFAVMLTTSCEVTDLAPPNIIPSDVVFSSKDKIEGAVFGVYEAAQRGWYSGSVQRGYPFGAASTTQGDMRGEDMYNDQLFFEVTYTNGQSPTTANNNGQWESLYRLINRANIVIEGLETAVANGVLTDQEANNYKAEMLFVRALAHHELLIFFCRPYSDNPSAPGVPYRTFAVNDVSKVDLGLQIGRGTVQEGYTQLLLDLDEAEAIYSGTNAILRGSKGAAIALKSRIKLHMQDWPGVVAEAAKLDGVYALTSTPDGPFTNPSSSENIFSLDNTAASNPGVNGALANMFGNPALGGRGLVKISPIIYQADFWLESDLRRSTLTSVNTNTGVYSAKYKAFGSFAEPTPLIRYSEVVLNAAEAHARMDDDSRAVEMLNSVRDRAVGAENAYTVAGLGDGVLEAIFNERRIELLAEGRRYPDIHRLSGEGLMNGIPAKAQSRSVTSYTYYTGETSVVSDHSLSYDDYRFIWPIPFSEVLSNPALSGAQNPGY